MAIDIPQILACWNWPETPGCVTLNCQPPELMANPFRGEFDTVEDATNAYIPWLNERLRDTSSKEYKWFEAASEHLAHGENLVLVGCDDEFCHTAYLRHLLKTGDWRRWDVHSAREWMDQVVQMLKEHWLDFDYFQQPDVNCYSLSDLDSFEPVIDSPGWCQVSRLMFEHQFLDLDDYRLPGGRRNELAWVRLFFNTHLVGKEASFLKTTDRFDAFKEILEVIRSTGDWPMTEEEHQLKTLTAVVEAGGSTADIHREAASLGIKSPWGVERLADALQKEQDSQADIEQAIERFASAGETPELHLEDFFPSDWLPSFHVLKEGLGFSDDYIIAAVLAVTGAMFPPSTRVSGQSMSEKVILWLFFIGMSGVAKSVLFNKAIVDPLQCGVIGSLEGVNKNELKQYSRAKAAHDQAAKKRGKNPEQSEELPPLIAPQKPRPKSAFYTSPTVQGLAADMNQFGHLVPGLMARDELSSWYAQLNDPKKEGDRSFWLSAYDGSPINESFSTQESRRVNEWAMSVIAFCQLKVFLQHLPEGNANGFNSRPLVFQMRRVSRNLCPDTEATKRLTQMLGDLYEAAFRLGPLEPLISALQTGIAPDEQLPAPDLSRRPMFWLEEAALRQFERVYRQLDDKGMACSDDDEDAIWSKASGQLLRWAAAVQFVRTYTRREAASDDWMPPDDVLPRYELAVLKQCFASAELEEHIRRFYPRISLESFDLATKLVIAGKTQSVELVQRSKDPTLQLLERFLELVDKRTPKSKNKGVKLSEIRKAGWPSKTRPPLDELKRLASQAASKGHVRWVGDDAVRSNRK